MKILYVYDKLPQVYQSYLLQLLNEIKKIYNINVSVYDYDKAADINFKTYSFFDYIQRALFKFRLTKVKSRDIAVMSKYDIIHLQHSYLFAKFLPFQLLRKENRPKIVITLRGSDTYMKPWIENRWKDFYNNKSQIVDAFITMSKHQKQYLQSWGIPGNKIYVVPISFGNRFVLTGKYPNSKKMKLVSAFRMVWEKNIDKCLRFAKTLKEKNIPFSYDIYGEGNDLSQLYYLIDRYNLEGFVFPKGVVKNTNLKEKLRSYDFFVQLSLSEAFPTTVLEAQSFGVPCIVSSVDGLPEAVLNNKTGIIDYADSLEILAERCLDIWNDKEKYKQYSENGINFVNANFSIENEIERLSKLYDNLMY